MSDKEKTPPPEPLVEKIERPLTPSKDKNTFEWLDIRDTVEPPPHPEPSTDE